MSNKSLELATYCQVTVANLMRRAREREDGQTSAEYIGIILVVVGIIAAVAATDIGTEVSKLIKNGIKSVKAGGSAEGD
ncbi:MAG: hypothetical protein KY433_11235 [Actinobacteria bacterium]|nr:hypothetical protein [Actinomycetota bacterium]